MKMVFPAQVRGKPRVEQLDRLAVPLLERDVFNAARLHGGDPLPVVAFPDRYVFLYFLHWLHRCLPQIKTGEPEVRREV